MQIRDFFVAVLWNHREELAAYHIFPITFRGGEKFAPQAVKVMAIRGGTGSAFFKRV
jgi:hypothetical protein